MKPHSFEHVKKKLPRDRIIGLLKVHFKNHTRLLGSSSLLNHLISHQDSMKQLSAFCKCCLPFIYKTWHDFSQPVSQQFGYNFINAAYEGYWSEFIDSLGIFHFRNESNKGGIAAFGEGGINKEFIKKSKEVRFELLP